MGPECLCREKKKLLKPRDDDDDDGKAKKCICCRVRVETLAIGANNLCALKLNTKLRLNSEYSLYFLFIYFFPNELTCFSQFRQVHRDCYLETVKKLAVVLSPAFQPVFSDWPNVYADVVLKKYIAKTNLEFFPTYFLFVCCVCLHYQVRFKKKILINIFFLRFFLHSPLSFWYTWCVYVCHWQFPWKKSGKLTPPVSFRNK